MQDIHKDKILILDFGSQYTQLIARRIREIGVYCKIYPYDINTDIIKNFSPNGIILSGGPDNITTNNPPIAPNIIFKLKVPILGICYGMQAMAIQMNGEATSANKAEYGFAKIHIHKSNDLFDNIVDEINSKGDKLLNVWMSHNIEVSKIPDGFELIASSNNCDIVAIANQEKKYYGIQFHPEVTHTTQGIKILTKFVDEICKCKKKWNPKNIINDLTDKLKNQIGNSKVLLALSGGVDSSVVAVLLHKIIGNKLTCVFVDNGLLRLNEGDSVMQTFANNIGINVIRVNAENKFYNALANEIDPEKKRHIIGKEFIDVFNNEALKIKDVTFLAQGTIYPDVIESAGTKNGKAKVIKSHHNVAGLPKNMSFKLVEPLKELFKDEVRKIGLELGLPHDMIYRHPFPGPGLGVRILGEVKKQYADILRLADNIFIEELHNHDLYNKTSQAFAVFLPIKSVGVTGDERRYDFVISLRAVETIDFMTAVWTQLPYDFLDIVSNRIINEVANVSRVVYDISSKPPATIEWE